MASTTRRPTLQEQEALANLWRTGTTGRHTTQPTRQALLAAGWVVRDRYGYHLTQAGRTVLLEAAGR